jgi:hypothetical protein
MGEYEDRYPEAYGHGEEVEPRKRHFLGWALPRQVRGGVSVEKRPQAAAAPPAEAQIPPSGPGPAAEPTKTALVRTSREICDDVWERLNQSPFIDASRVTVSVDGAEVTLDGAINSLIAISLAQSLAADVAGVGRVQVRLRVDQPARG